MFLWRSLTPAAIATAAAALTRGKPAASAPASTAGSASMAKGGTGISRLGIAKN